MNCALYTNDMFCYGEDLIHYLDQIQYKNPRIEFFSLSFVINRELMTPSPFYDTVQKILNTFPRLRELEVKLHRKHIYFWATNDILNLDEWLKIDSEDLINLKLNNGFSKSPTICDNIYSTIQCPNLQVLELSIQDLDDLIDFIQRHPDLHRLKIGAVDYQSILPLNLKNLIKTYMYGILLEFEESSTRCRFKIYPGKSVISIVRKQQTL
jgi:hypothetical protein